MRCDISILCLFFFFNDTATTEIYTYLHTLSLHDALPIFVLLIEGPRLPGAHAVIDLRIVLTKISRRAIEIVAAGLGLGRDDVRTQGVYGLLARCPGWRNRD